MTEPPTIINQVPPPPDADPWPPLPPGDKPDANAPKPMTGDAESDQGGAHGLLMWGQGGIYNAPDDRMVTTALSDAVVGTVKPVALTPLSGLSFSIAPGWLAIAACSDGTTCVVGSRQTHIIGPDDGVTAGNVTGARDDFLWCDVYPDDGIWRLVVIPRAQSIGRAGVPLANLSVPAGANLATQFTVGWDVPTHGHHSDGTPRGVTAVTTGTNAYVMTPNYPIAPIMIRPRAQFRLKAFGWGRWGNTPRAVLFRTADTSSPLVSMGPIPEFQANTEFSWDAEVVVQVRMLRQNYAIKVAANINPGQGPVNVGTYYGLHAIRITNLTTWNPDGWHHLHLQGAWGSTAANQYLECLSSSFETIEPYEGGPWPSW